MVSQWIDKGIEEDKSVPTCTSKSKKKNINGDKIKLIKILIWI